MQTLEWILGDLDSHLSEVTGMFDRKRRGQEDSRFSHRLRLIYTVRKRKQILFLSLLNVNIKLDFLQTYPEIFSLSA